MQGHCSGRTGAGAEEHPSRTGTSGPVGRRRPGQAGGVGKLVKADMLVLLAALEMIDPALGQSGKQSDPATEARQLAQRAAAFAAIGNWPETLALARRAWRARRRGTARPCPKGVNRMAAELNVFEREMRYRDFSIPADDTLRALAYMHAAIPHMEAYLRETKLDAGGTAGASPSRGTSFGRGCGFPPPSRCIPTSWIFASSFTYSQTCTRS